MHYLDELEVLGTFGPRLFVGGLWLKVSAYLSSSFAFFGRSGCGERLALKDELKKGDWRFGSW